MQPANSRARFATVCSANRFFRTVEENRAQTLGLLDLALRHNPDLVCLPEAFTTTGTPDGTNGAETVPGPTIDAVAALARKHRCYVVCPIFTRQEGDRPGTARNSAVVIGRSGEIVGVYDKRRPVTSSHDYTSLEDGIVPGTGDGVFDLDFGRIGIRICFDVGFPEDWSLLAASGVRLVLWPSAYDGGFALTAYAQLHRFWVVTSVRTTRSRIIDPCGVTLAETDPQLGIAVRDVNLDFAVCHYDFNWSVPERILSDYAGRVDVRSHWDSACFLVEPTDPSVTTASLMAQYGFETADRYFERHREAYAALQRGDTPAPQAAAHGNRPAYAKQPR